MIFGIITFPVSKHHNNFKKVINEYLGHNTKFIFHKENSFEDVDVIIIPDGFYAFYNYSKEEILKYSPVFRHVIQFSRNGGLVIGVDKGFNILCKLGLLPGEIKINDSEEFICDTTFIKADNSKSPYTILINTDESLCFPIAHEYGRFQAESNILIDMRLNEQILFRYCDSSGEVSTASNPDGSVENIAGICNQEKNIIGLMPHPERAMGDLTESDDGRFFFESLIFFFYKRLEDKQIMEN